MDISSDSRLENLARKEAEGAKKNIYFLLLSKKFLRNFYNQFN